MKDHHMADDIQLYALGVLDRDESRAVEAHAAGCAECSQLLGEAERTVAALDAMTVTPVAPPAALAARIAASSRVVVPMRSRRFDFARGSALAAGLAFAVLGTGSVREILSDRATISADDRAFSAIAVSHFTHTTFTKIAPSAPTAKVLWGKSPHWLYVIVDAPQCDCEVAGITAGGVRDLGAPVARGATATLFVADAPDVTSVELRSGATILSSATRP